MRHLTFVASLFIAGSLAAQPAVTTIAGVPTVPGFRDGIASEALFTHPTWLDVVRETGDPQVGDEGKAGEIFVVDRINQRLRFISAAGVVTTLDVVSPVFPPSQHLDVDFGTAFGGGILIEPPRSGCGSGAYARGVWVSFSGAHRVPLLNFGGGQENRDGFVTLDTGAGSFPTSLARTRAYANVGAIVVAQRLYAADTGNDTILSSGFTESFEFCPQALGFKVLAGKSGEPGYVDGKGAEARFNTPRGIAVAPDDTIYVTDSGNHAIRHITKDGVVTTVAGQPGTPGSNDGPALQAHFNTPSGIDVDDDGNVFIVDTFNHTIRELTKDGNVITVAGQAGVSGFADGDGKSARFNAPVGLKIAPDGSLLVADTGNNCIRRVTLKVGGSAVTRFRGYAVSKRSTA